MTEFKCRLDASFHCIRLYAISQHVCPDSRVVPSTFFTLYIAAANYIAGHVVSHNDPLTLLIGSSQGYRDMVILPLVAVRFEVRTGFMVAAKSRCTQNFASANQPLQVKNDTSAQLHLSHKADCKFLRIGRARYTCSPCSELVVQSSNTAADKVHYGQCSETANTGSKGEGRLMSLIKNGSCESLSEACPDLLLTCC